MLKFHALERCYQVDIAKVTKRKSGKFLVIIYQPPGAGEQNKRTIHMPSTLQLSNSNVLFISIKFLTVDAHEAEIKEIYGALDES